MLVPSAESTPDLCQAKEILGLDIAPIVPDKTAHSELTCDWLSMLDGQHLRLYRRAIIHLLIAERGDLSNLDRRLHMEHARWKFDYGLMEQYFKDVEMSNVQSLTKSFFHERQWRVWVRLMEEQLKDGEGKARYSSCI